MIENSDHLMMGLVDYLFSKFVRISDIYIFLGQEINSFQLLWLGYTNHVSILIIVIYYNDSGIS